ncbi:MAG: beta-lactamase family protein [Clostridiales bacterium]|nr:beta-lactamase family protein [Clostridiales bacterium]
MEVIKGNVDCSPTDALYQEERLEVVNQCFEKLIQEQKLLSGSYCLARDNKVFANNALGKLTYIEGDERAFQPDSIYGIYSVTKMFTAVAILQLVENGRIRLDQPVGEIIHEFHTPPFQQIQVIHLLTHTSGLYCDDGVKEDKHHEGVEEIMCSDNWLHTLLSKGVSSAPGKEWTYCSLGYNVLGEIITRISGVFCHDYITENILKPCEMHDTHWEYSSEYKERYNMRFEWTKEWIDSADSRNQQKPEKLIPRTWNGLLSTSDDLMKFGSMLLNNGKYKGRHVLGRKAVESYRRLHTSSEVLTYCWGANGVYKSFGAGCDIFSESDVSQLITPGTFSHEGWGTCCLAIDYKERFVVVWSSQFKGYEWYPEPLRNIASAIWSGLE